MSKNSRKIIYPKDVAAITGKNYRTSWILLAKIKKHFGKESHHVVTVDEFCTFMGIRQESVISFFD